MKVLLKTKKKYLFIGILITVLLLAAIYFTGIWELRSGLPFASQLARAGRGLNRYETRQNSIRMQKNLNAHKG